MHLIVDRTYEDVQRVKYLRMQKVLGLASKAELAEWETDLKGAYNVSDLVRVENAVSALATMLQLLPVKLQQYAASLGVAWDRVWDVPYDPENYVVETIQVWPVVFVLEADLQRYLDNVYLLRSSLLSGSGGLPRTMRGLTWLGANAIEQTLLDLHKAIDQTETKAKTQMYNASKTWYYSGELYGGESA